MKTMPVVHRLLAVTVAALWGVNFLAIDISLGYFPPMLLVALRFGILAVPTLLFVPCPAVKLRWLIGYGLGFGVAQFLFLYWAMDAGIPTGLASLVLQASAPFTVMLAATFLRERLTGVQLVGILIAVAGLGVVGWSRWQAAGFLPFALTLLAALGWAVGNICNREAHTTEPLRLTLWMSVVPPVPMLLVSLVVEGPGRIQDAVLGLGTHEGLEATAGLMFTVIVATLMASGIWTWLMSRHPSGVVAPFSLLVPVFGMSTAWLVLGERPTTAEFTGAVLVVGGVLLGTATLRRGTGRPSPGRRPR